MANIGMKFNALEVKPAGAGAGQLPVSGPEGWPVQIVASEMKEVSGKPNCGYLELTLEIIEGENAGQTGVDRLNIHNDNQQTVEIAHRQFSAYCHVTGRFEVEDSSVLHNIPFRAVVTLQKPKKNANADEEPVTYTEIKYVKNYDGTAPGKGQPGTGSAGARPNVAPQVNPAPVAAQPTPTAQPAATAANTWGGTSAAPTNPAPVAAQNFEEGAVPATPSWKK